MCSSSRRCRRKSPHTSRRRRPRIVGAAAPTRGALAFSRRRRASYRKFMISILTKVELPLTRDAGGEIHGSARTQRFHQARGAWGRAGGCLDPWPRFRRPDRCGRHQSPHRFRRPLSAPARAQPGRLVPVGAGGVRQGEGREQTNLPVDRLFHLLLVPCRGKDDLFRSRHRGADEQVVRQRQGGPRAAAGRRPALHHRHRNADPAWGMAEQPVPDARRQAVLRRQLLSAEGRRRSARLSARARGHPRFVGKPSRRQGDPGGRRTLRRAEESGGGAARQAARAGDAECLAEAGLGGVVEIGRSRQRWPRQPAERSEIPAGPGARSPAGRREDRP